MIIGKWVCVHLSSKRGGPGGDEEIPRSLRSSGAIRRSRELLAWQGRISSREKSPRDLVTEADLASQQAIEGVIRESFPEHGFVGEEGDPSTSQSESEYRWYVDPLDGTANYVHGMRPYCVSVALARGNEVLVGVVYDPTHDECFQACRGMGALLNGSSVRVSGCCRMDQAMIASSFSANVQRDSEEIRQFVEISAESQSLRRIGSAALNLCYLGGGRLDTILDDQREMLGRGCGDLDRARGRWNRHRRGRRTVPAGASATRGSLDRIPSSVSRGSAWTGPLTRISGDVGRRLSIVISG